MALSRQMGHTDEMHARLEASAREADRKRMLTMGSREIERDISNMVRHGMGDTQAMILAVECLTITRDMERTKYAVTPVLTFADVDKSLAADKPKLTLVK